MFKCGLYFELFIQCKEFFFFCGFKVCALWVKRKVYYYCQTRFWLAPPSLTAPSPLQGAAGKDAMQEGHTLYIILTRPDLETSYDCEKAVGIHGRQEDFWERPNDSRKEESGGFITFPTSFLKGSTSTDCERRWEKTTWRLSERQEKEGATRTY